MLEYATGRHTPAGRRRHDERSDDSSPSRSSSSSRRSAWVVLGGLGRVPDRHGGRGAPRAGRAGCGAAAGQRAPTFAARRQERRHGRLAIAGSDVTADFDARPAAQGAAVVRDVRRRLRGDVPRAQPRRRRARSRVDMASAVPDAAATTTASREGRRPGAARDVRRTASRAPSFRVSPRGARRRCEVGVPDAGLDDWRYVPSAEGAGASDDFTLVMTHRLRRRRLPRRRGVAHRASGATATAGSSTWRYDSLVTGRPIALEMPKPLNPGPLAVADLAVRAGVAAVLLRRARAAHRHARRAAPPDELRVPGGRASSRSTCCSRTSSTASTSTSRSRSRRVTSVALCVGYLRLVVGRGARAGRDRRSASSCSSCCSATASSSRASRGWPSRSARCSRSRTSWRDRPYRLGRGVRGDEAALPRRRQPPVPPAQTSASPERAVAATRQAAAARRCS